MNPDASPVNPISAVASSLRRARRPMTGATVLPAAASFHRDAATPGRPGVLFCHGFTGSPASLRPWAEAVADAGYAVSLPRLPGHGTNWHEMQRTEWADWHAAVEREYRRLAERCDGVVVAGLSMGGGLALRLAEDHAEDDDMRAVVLVNPAINSTDPTYRLLGMARHLLASRSSIGNDIALEGTDEASYDRTPLAPAYSMVRAWADVRADLSRIHAPVLLFTSRTDHVVDASSARLITEQVRHLDHRWLEHSWHVATLDHDAPLIVAGTLDLLATLSRSEAASTDGRR